MKFLCMKCNSFMDYESKEQVDTLRLGITFACGECGTKVAMVTNPGETQLVSGLGVKIGGRTIPAEPMEFTKGAIKPETGDAADAMGKCPFPGMLAESESKDSGIGDAMSQMMSGMMGGMAGAGQSTGAGVPWTAEAEKRLENVPSFVRSLAKSGIEQYAKDNGFNEVNAQVMDEYREKVGM
ncbi:MAG TPA: PCP reductase family protein [Nitrospiria bacterium]